MTDDLIYEAARLMAEQTADFARLEVACRHLTQALIQGEPAAIDSLTRAGETELLQMRSRLVRIIQSLTAFANLRSSAPEANQITKEARATFESASKDLLRAAGDFQRTRARAAALTTGGSTFAAACIEFCGVQPSTYNAPYTRMGDSRPWA